MNIVEALKTGKLIRRKNHLLGNDYGEVLNYTNHGIVFKYGNSIMPIFITDILADDWEAKEEMPNKEKL